MSNELIEPRDQLVSFARFRSIRTWTNSESSRRRWRATTGVAKLTRSSACARCTRSRQRRTLSP